MCAHVLDSYPGMCVAGLGMRLWAHVCTCPRLIPRCGWSGNEAMSTLSIRSVPLDRLTSNFLSLAVYMVKWECLVGIAWDQLRLHVD